MPVVDAWHHRDCRLLPPAPAGRPGGRPETSSRAGAPRRRSASDRNTSGSTPAKTFCSSRGGSPCLDDDRCTDALGHPVPGEPAMGDTRRGARTDHEPGAGVVVDVPADERPLRSGPELERRPGGAQHLDVHDRHVDALDQDARCRAAWRRRPTMRNPASSALRTSRATTAAIAVPARPPASAASRRAGRGSPPARPPSSSSGSRYSPGSTTT